MYNLRIASIVYLLDKPIDSGVHELLGRARTCRGIRAVAALGLSNMNVCHIVRSETRQRTWLATLPMAASGDTSTPVKKGRFALRS